MTRPGPGHPGRRRAVRTVGGLVAGATLVALVLGSGGREPAAASVTWGGSEGHPSCAYDPAFETVEAVLVMTGDPGSAAEVTVKVTAYADENTSEPVGSATRRLDLDGLVGRPILVTFEVDGPPKVDADGVAACSLDVTR